MSLDPLLAIRDASVDHVDAGFLQAVILAREQDQMAVMCKPSYEGSCHLLIIQNVYPSGEFQICIEYYYLARISFLAVERRNCLHAFYTLSGGHL